MKPRALLLLALLLCVLQGCSSLSSYMAGARYAVSNKSPGIIVIRYFHVADSNNTVDNPCPITGMQAYPEITTALVPGIKAVWQKLPNAKFVLNPTACSVQVAIIPGAAVTVPFSEKISGTASIRLEISNANGEVQLTGADIFERFAQIEEELYVYVFSDTNNL